MRSCTGFPASGRSSDGDIVSIDIGCTYKGFVADMAVTVGVGNVSPEAQRLIDVTKEALWCGIRAARGGSRVGDIGHASPDVRRGPGAVYRAGICRARCRAADARGPADSQLRESGHGHSAAAGHGDRHRADGEHRRPADKEGFRRRGPSGRWTVRSRRISSTRWRSRRVRRKSSLCRKLMVC